MDRIYINKCGVDELMTIEGIGIKSAESILVLRQAVGNLVVEDLARLPRLKLSQDFVRRIDYAAFPIPTPPTYITATGEPIVIDTPLGEVSLEGMEHRQELDLDTSATEQKEQIVQTTPPAVREDDAKTLIENVNAAISEHVAEHPPPGTVRKLPVVPNPQQTPSRDGRSWPGAQEGHQTSVLVTQPSIPEAPSLSLSKREGAVPGMVGLTVTQQLI